MLKLFPTVQMTDPLLVNPEDAVDQALVFIFIAHKLYPVALGISIDKSKYSWMMILMSDKAGIGHHSPCCIFFSLTKISVLLQPRVDASV
jgi:hypothetical protein